VEAACATIASPDRYEAVDVGEDLSCISSMTGCANPAVELLEEAQATLGDDAHISTILTIGAGRMDNTLLSTNSEHGRYSEAIRNVSMNAEALHQELQKRLGSLTVYYRFNVEVNMSQGDPKLIRSFTLRYLKDGKVNTRLNEALAHLMSRKDGHALKEISE
jgi:hypothetical protein